MTKLLTGDNVYNRTMSRVFDVVLLSVLTLVCCLPVVTAGAALSSACAMFMKIDKDREGAICRGFFREFREELPRSVGGWLVHLMIATVLAADLYLTRSRSLQYGLILALFFIWSAVFIWYLCLRARFRENTVSALNNALKFAVVFFPVTMICGVYVMALTALIYWRPLLMGLLPVAGVGMFMYLPAVLIGKKIDGYIADKGLVAENAAEAECGEAITSVTGDVNVLTEASVQYRDVSKAEGFRKYLAVRLRAEKDKFARMKKTERTKYLMTYYKGVVFSLVALTAIGVIVMVEAKAAKREEILRIAVVNSYHENALANEEIAGMLSEDLVPYGMQVTENTDVIYDTDYQIAYETGGKTYASTAANDSDYDKFFLNIANGRIDAAIVPESFVSYCDALEDVYEGTAADITDSEFVRQAGIAFVGDNAGEKYFLILPAGGMNRENASLFRDYLIK